MCIYMHIFIHNLTYIEHQQHFFNQLSLILNKLGYYTEKTITSSKTIEDKNCRTQESSESTGDVKNANAVHWLQKEHDMDWGATDLKVIDWSSN